MLHNRQTLLAAVVAAALSGSCPSGSCPKVTELLHSGAATTAIGAATATALEVRADAVEVARSGAAAPSSLCRPAAAAGPHTVETEVALALKRPGRAARRLTEHHRWRRDTSGAVAHEVRLDFRLPDGRAASRSREDRRVDAAHFSAIDGRFVDAARIADFEPRVEAAGHAPVDALLSLLTLDGGTLRARRFGEPAVCRTVEPTPALPQPSAAALELSAGVRAGWLRFDDPDSGATMIVRFRETHTAGAEAVQPPETLWPVDPDRSFAEVSAFVAAGLEAGWLDPPDVDVDDSDGAQTRAGDADTGGREP